MTRGNAQQKFLEVYARWEQSGMNRAAFCKQEDIKYSWFMSHQKNMRRRNKQTGFELIEPVPVADKLISATIEFHYPDGRYFVFGIGTPLSLIRKIAG